MVRGQVTLFTTVASKPTQFSRTAPPVESNVYPVFPTGQLQFQSYHIMSMDGSLVDKYRSLSEQVEDLFWFLSENCDTLCVRNSCVVNATVCVRGPSNVHIPVSRLIRLGLIRHACTAGLVSFPVYADPNLFEITIGEDLYSRVQLSECFTEGRSTFGLRIQACRAETTLCAEVLDSGVFRGPCVVRCTHTAHARKYRIVALSSVGAAELMIPNLAISVLEYFKKMNINLKHPELVGIDLKGRFIPLELCRVFATKPAEQSQTTIELLQRVLAPVGLTVGDSPILFTPRALPVVNRPLVRLGRVRVCVIKFGPERTDPISSSCEVVHTISVLVYTLLDWEMQVRSGLAKLGSPIDMFLVRSSKKLHPNVYSRLKYVLDVCVGIPSQLLVCDVCQEVLLSEMQRKLGVDEERSKMPSTCAFGIWTERVGSVQIVGAVLSTNQGMTKYVSRVSVCEIGPTCNNLDEIFYDLLVNFFQVHASFPTRLVGLKRHNGNRQTFSMLTNELRAISTAIGRLNREIQTGINPNLLKNAPQLNPGVSLIYCDKMSGITDQRIYESLHDQCMNFQMHAHHYHVLHDTNKFSQVVEIYET